MKFLLVINIICSTVFELMSFDVNKHLKYQFVSNETYRILYGDITNFDDLFNVSLDDIDYNETRRNIKPRNITKTPNFIVEAKFLEELENNDPLPNKTYLGISKESDYRRYRIVPGWWYYQVHEWFDYWYFTRTVEAEKRDMLLKFGLQFLIHARMKFSKALKQKEPLAQDKRYRLGYLFNRFRMLNYFQMRLMSAIMYAYSYSQDNKNYKVVTAIRIYEKVVRLDVDMRDTVTQIRKVLEEPTPPNPFKSNLDRELYYSTDDEGPEQSDEE